MPVDTPCQSYQENIAQWSRVRDCLAGSDVIKSKGTTYLPKPAGLSNSDFDDYTMRAEFYPATARTLDGLAGAVFRKDPLMTVPEAQEKLLEEATLRGEDITTFAKRVVRDVISVGRFGSLVDFDESMEKPFVAGYRAENIINWRVTVIDRRPVVTLIVLKEAAYAPDADDPFATVEVERWRVLLLGHAEAEDVGPLVYSQQVWEKREEDKDPMQIGGTIIPTRRGKPLEKIPFTFFGPFDLSPDPQKAPLLDLSDVNLSHYRTSAELEEGAYFTGLPMYWVAGRMQGSQDEGEVEFTVGSRQALLLEEGSTAGVLSVDGGDMGILKTLMDDKEKRMAVLGARILEDQKAGVEAAATVTMRHAGESSLLSSISGTCSKGMAQVVEDLVWWDGVEPKDIGFELNKDFISGQIAPSELVQLVAAYQQGALGPKAFFKAMQDGERVPHEWTLEDWLKDIDDGRELLDAQMANEDDGDEEDDEEDDDQGGDDKKKSPKDDTTKDK